MLTQEAIRQGLRPATTEAEEKGAKEYAAARGKSVDDLAKTKVNAASKLRDDKAQAKADADAKAKAKAEADKKQPMMPDLDNMKMADLKALAKGRDDVKVGFGTTKAALIKALRKSLSK